MLSLYSGNQSEGVVTIQWCVVKPLLFVPIHLWAHVYAPLVHCKGGLLFKKLGNNLEHVRRMGIYTCTLYDFLCMCVHSTDFTPTCCLPWFHFQWQYLVV